MILTALIAIESGGNDRAVGKGGELGCLQISPICRKDVERITRRSIPKEDLFDRRKSCEIALVYLNHYVNRDALGREPTLRDYALVWHYGPQGWRRKGIDRYWTKVQSVLP
jgi:soluble lytic murein transglycosylase-like protein